MYGINEIMAVQPISMPQFYKGKLGRRIFSPSIQSMIAIIREIESEYFWLMNIHHGKEREKFVANISTAENLYLK